MNPSVARATVPVITMAIGFSAHAGGRVRSSLLVEAATTKDRFDRAGPK